MLSPSCGLIHLDSIGCSPEVKTHTVWGYPFHTRRHRYLERGFGLRRKLEAILLYGRTESFREVTLSNLKFSKIWKVWEQPEHNTVPWEKEKWAATTFTRRLLIQGSGGSIPFHLSWEGGWVCREKDRRDVREPELSRSDKGRMDGDFPMR